MARPGSKEVKIIWAVDAFEEVGELRANVIRTIEVLSKNFEFEVTPTFVLSPAHLGVDPEQSGPWVKQYLTAAERALASKLSHLPFTISKPVTLTLNASSLRETAEGLSEFAARRRSDLLVLASHSRQGPDRFVLGSFAETLIQQAKVPLLVVGRHSKKTSELKKVLFPTDLSQGSMAVFKEFLKLAGPLGAAITLHHVISNPIEPVVQSGVYLLSGGWVPLNTFFQSSEAQAREVAQKWIDLAQAHQVACTFEVETGASSVSNAVLQKAQGADLVAIAAQSGRLATFFLGSIARQILRSSPCPVWIARAPQAKAAKKAPVKTGRKKRR